YLRIFSIMAERLQKAEKKSLPQGWKVKVESCLWASLMDGIPYKFFRTEILIATGTTEMKESGR
ncbi:hypothetical protein OAL03_04520, partial [Akkermansiaceae bacterium]|nr:hypothetical protein [Akkermansiaceae bacterium]